MFGIREIVVILVVALIIFVFFGSAKIPEFAKSLKKGIDEFKKGTDELKKTVDTTAKEAVDSVETVETKK
ncbi:MAG: twin-arginine translocase TatA/TatE family subunit [Caldiserica bacterium]|nr:twin-arginine translocase TatA/TatE family subunit [Caldisericota bacterium]